MLIRLKCYDTLWEKSIKIVFETAILKSYFVDVRVKNTALQGGLVGVGSVMFFENLFLHSVVQNVIPSYLDGIISQRRLRKWDGSANPEKVHSFWEKL